MQANSIISPYLFKRIYVKVFSEIESSQMGTENWTYSLSTWIVYIRVSFCDSFSNLFFGIWKMWKTWQSIDKLYKDFYIRCDFMMKTYESLF